MAEFYFHIDENIVGKRENAGYQHSFSHNVMKKPILSGGGRVVVKNWNCVMKN